MSTRKIDGCESTMFGCIPFKADEKNHIQTTLQKNVLSMNTDILQHSSDSQFDNAVRTKIEVANSVFSFNGWSDQIINMNVDYLEQEMNLWCAGVTAIVRVILKDGSFHENLGFAEVKNTSKGLALQEAKNKAVMIARQQCLQLYGSCFHSSESFSNPSTKEEITPASNLSSKTSSQIIDPTMDSQDHKSLPTSKQSYSESSENKEDRKTIPLHAYQPSLPSESLNTAQSPVLTTSNKSFVSNQPAIPPVKPVEQATAEDMEGLEDIDLSNLAIDMSPQDPGQPIQPVQQAQPVQHGQSIQITKPYQNGSAIIPDNVPFRNQANIQGVQQNIVHRSMDGSPMIRHPLPAGTVSTGDMMNTVQGNSFSMKRNSVFAMPPSKR